MIATAPSRRLSKTKTCPVSALSCSRGRTVASSPTAGHRKTDRPQGADYRRGLRIGAAVAIAFAREGADVAINYLPAEEEDADAIIDLTLKTNVYAMS